MISRPKPRVLSGMQPSGLLHLGNYLGALQNWKQLQAEHECFFFVADWHALSTNYADTSRMREYVRELLIEGDRGERDPRQPADDEEDDEPDDPQQRGLEPGGAGQDRRYPGE